MKYFFDTEFIEDGKTIDLISIGIVAEDGREFYAEMWAIPWNKASDWVHRNVKPHLTGKIEYDRYQMKKAVELFVNPEVYGEPEFYAYYADYDWVVFCQIFGTMMDLPEGFPMFCMDLKQMMEERSLGSGWKAKNAPDPENEHNALADALWNKRLYDAMQGPTPNKQGE